jgi:hypothetical protein
MKRFLIDLLKGHPLVNEEAYKNWRFIFFVLFLFILMIYAAHRIDQKVIKIDGLNRQLSALRNEHVDNRQRIQKARLESTLRNQLAPIGLQPTDQPPLILIVE